MKKLLLLTAAVLATCSMHAQNLTISNTSSCTVFVTAYMEPPGVCGPSAGAPSSTYLVPPATFTTYGPAPGGGGMEWRWAHIIDDGAVRCGASTGPCSEIVGTFPGAAGGTLCVYPRVDCVNIGRCNSSCPSGTHVSIAWTQWPSGNADIEIFP